MNPSNLRRFSSALSTASQLDAAIDQVSSALADLDGPPDLAVVFLSAHWSDDCETIAETLCNRLGTENLLGCTAESVLGGGQEIENSPAMSLWLAKLPDLSLTPMYLNYQRTPDGGGFLGWADELLDGWPEHSTLLTLGDPFSFPADVLLEQLANENPNVLAAGGMCSGGEAPGESRLLLGTKVYDEGAATILLSGTPLQTVVSQGCRPIGEPLVVTRAERNIIYELGGKTALLQLNTIFDELPTHEQELVRQGLQVGRVVSEYQDRFEAGDFLIRNLIGADPDTGALAIGDYIRVGQTIQFHIRDHKTADADLRELLAAHRKQHQPAAALLFTCNGRGTRLFDKEHHDAAAVQNAWGEIPVAGFFAQGELGPVGGSNFMHGFTASILVF